MAQSVTAIHGSYTFKVGMVDPRTGSGPVCTSIRLFNRRISDGGVNKDVLTWDVFYGGANPRYVIPAENSGYIAEL